MNHFNEPSPETKVTYQLRYFCNRFECWVYNDEYDTKEELNNQITFQKKCGHMTMQIREITKTSKYEAVQ